MTPTPTLGCPPNSAHLLCVRGTAGSKREAHGARGSSAGWEEPLTPGLGPSSDAVFMPPLDL